MRKRFLFLFLLVFALSSHRVFADPVRITSGVFVLDIELDIIDFNGDGFSLKTVPSLTTLVSATKQFARGGDPSSFAPFAIEMEGQVIDWGFETTGGEQLLARGADVVLGGSTTTNVDLVGSMRIDAVPTPLTFRGDPDFVDFEYVAPFFFEAMIRGIQGPNELFARNFIGSGRVFVNYEGTNDGIYGFADESIRYEFDAAAPVPEPGTLLLLGSGLAGVVLRRRQHR
jgi:hypothetical protein